MESGRGLFFIFFLLEEWKVEGVILAGIHSEKILSMFV